MQNDFDRILIARDQIAERVCGLAREIGKVYGAEGVDELVLVTILSGSLIFLADLIRQLPLKMKIGLMAVSSYRGQTAGAAKILHDLSMDVTGRHVLLIDDILDTGGTLRFVRERLAEGAPASIRTCVLLRKPAKAPADVPADFVGFDIEDVFVVGYGLDYNDWYRNFPDIGVLREELKIG